MEICPINLGIDKCLSDLLGGCFKFFKEPIEFSTCPKKNKKNLEKEMNKLKKIQQDVPTKIREQERSQPGTECKVEVKRWLENVNDTEKDVNTLREELTESRSCTYCCYPRVNYLLGKKVVRLIDQVHSLLEDWKNFDDKNLVHSVYDPIKHVPDLPTTMVGRERKSLEIHGYLRDSQVTSIGIWGMGGIGKTTMLKSIKRWLSVNDHGFHYIIWIEMSQNEDDILKIQKQIAKCFPFPVELQHEEKENAEYFRNTLLQRRKSLVLIDNVWKKLDFERIGIPSAVGTTVVKILFTTRSEVVCHDMRAQNIVRLDSLDETESLQLFQGNISPHVKLTENFVRQRVDEILKRCGGLPLVIKKVARTVAYYTQVQEWNDAVECLSSSPEEMEGMDDVMKCLKLSYDKLEDDKIKSCLLYLSLYPEGSQILTDVLIKQWLAEGFLDTPNDNSFRRSYTRGVKNINKLKSTCLVEKSVLSDTSDQVKLHDVIRQMLCWIRKHENEEVFIVHNDEISDCNYDGWGSAKRICLLEGQLKSLPENGMPSCSNLTNLLVTEDYDHQIDKLPTKFFFDSTPSLRVLNLRFTGLVDIPKSIGELVELRYLKVTQLCLRRLEMSSGTLTFMFKESRPFSRLKKLLIFSCQRLKELSWTARIPSLEELIVDNCNRVKELVKIREEHDYFLKLYKLKIKNLKNLERIHGRSPLLFPALRHLFIENCPKLKQLSFGDESAKNLEYIKCEKTQWELLEWENDQVEAKFSPYVNY